jgi:hypothetical protein
MLSQTVSDGSAVIGCGSLGFAGETPIQLKLTKK